MQKFINQILTEIRYIEMQLPSSSDFVEPETIIQQLIHKAYQLFEFIEEIQADFSKKEEQFKAQIQTIQNDFILTLAELDRQKQCVITFGELYQKLEEQSTSNQLAYDLQIQSLESKLKESELSQVSLKLNFEQTITQFKEYLYQKDLDLQQSNMKLQTLIEQCQSNNSQTNYTASHKQGGMNSIVSLQNLEAVEQGDTFEAREQENIFEISEEGKAKNGQSYNSLKTPSVKQMSKIINSKCELDDQIFRFGTLQLNSQFVSKMHTRHNSFGYNFPLIPISLQKEMTFDKKIETNKQRNIYENFFHLISQCVKLDLKENKMFVIEVNHLYDEFIKNNIPFNKWYSNIKAYLKQQE